MGQNAPFPEYGLAADSSTVVNYRRDAGNYITQVFAAQLPAIQTGFFNARLTRGIIITPHWHTNASELVFVIGGEVMTSVFNPFSRQLMSYRLAPGQVSVFPKGWFHWILALTDAYLLTIFDRPTPDIVYGADFLRFTPAHVLHRAYCIDEAAFAAAIAPLTESVILGPPRTCP